MRSTQYIIGFAAIVCLVCGIVVAGSAESLKERQEINKQLDQKKKVLGVVSLYESGQVISPEQIDQLFADNIQAMLTLAPMSWRLSTSAKRDKTRRVARWRMPTLRRWPVCPIKPSCTSR